MTEDYKEMLTYVLKDDSRKFRFYFEDRENKEFSKAMIFINGDGSILLGVGVEFKHPVNTQCKT